MILQEHRLFLQSQSVIKNFRIFNSKDVFLVCFSVTDKQYMDNVVNKWNPELKHFAPDVPKILVGTKLDLRREHFKDDNSKEIDEAILSNLVSPAQVIPLSLFLIKSRGLKLKFLFLGQTTSNVDQS